MNLKLNIYLLLFVIGSRGLSAQIIGSKGLSAQTGSFSALIDRTVILYIEIPSSVLLDSCFFSNTLLMVEINKFSKVISVEFSDNAEEWEKTELIKLKNEKRINYSKLDALAKKEGIKNCKLLFPVIIRSLYSCRENLTDETCEYDRKYFQFQGKYLQGNIIFKDDVGFSFNKPVF